MSKPKGKVNIKWSPSFAYAIGLIVTDGNLSPDGRHISFSSKDIELIRHFLDALGISEQYIGKKTSGYTGKSDSFVVQFGDVLFYRFLLEIGLMPNKSKVLKEITIPKELFPHFLRGLFDGDGTSFSYWDKRWKSSFLLYIAFASASHELLDWLRDRIFSYYGITGHISITVREHTRQLRFAKKSSVALQGIMYENANNLYLKRKHLKITTALSIMPALQEKCARMAKR